MMGGKTPEICWAVNKRQDNKLENCCIWLVSYLYYTEQCRSRRKERYCISHTLSAPSRPQRFWGVTNCCRIIHAESALNLKSFSHSLYAQRTPSVHSRLAHSHTKYSLPQFKCICPWPHSVTEMYDCFLIGMRMSLLWKWASGLWCALYPYLVPSLRQHELVSKHTAHQTSSSLITFT